MWQRLSQTELGGALEMRITVNMTNLIILNTFGFPGCRPSNNPSLHLAIE